MRERIPQPKIEIIRGAIDLLTLCPLLALYSKYLAKHIFLTDY